MKPVLSVRDLTVEFPTPTGPFRAVDGVSFDLAPSERLGLVGESGSGKTTTMLAILRMIRRPGRVASGVVLLDGEDLLALPPEAMRGKRFSRIAFIPQGAMSSLNPVLRIAEQSDDVMRAHGVRLSPAELDRRLAFLLSRVGLKPEVARLYPHELSGGMKQRVCIAMAIALEPHLILADEPTSALDVVVQKQVLTTLRQVQEEIGAAVVLVGHDLGLMAQFAQRVGVMYQGRLVELAPVRQIFHEPQQDYTRMLIASLPSLTERREQAGRAYPSSSESVLEAEDVAVTFGHGASAKKAVDGVSLAIGGDRAKIIAIVGESGSGKTTLTRLLLGFLTPTSGTVRYDGRDLRLLDGAGWRAFRAQVQAIFQDPFEVFNPFYKVDRALAIPLRSFGIATSRAEMRRRIEQALVTVGLRPEHTLGRYPHQLSGGQRQRVMIARALLLKPRIILADEPVSMVDASLRASILESLARLRSEHGISLIYVTHDLTTAYQIADEVVVLYGGKVMERGDAEQVIRRPTHSYTRQLIDAIPPPDPDAPWGKPELAAAQ